MKLLIVDDEKLDREGLANQLPWGDFGISSLTTAASGTEALELIRMDPPDIILSDVKMPGMSGLELVEKALAIKNDLQVVFVSGYDDFDYIKNALRLQAREYILKPVRDDELRQVISKVAAAVTLDRQRKSMMANIEMQAEEGKVLLKKKRLPISCLIRPAFQTVI